MLAPTHSVFGMFLTLIILAVFGVQWSLHWTIILFAILGAVIPDIDHPKSIIGKFFYIISAPLERRYGHRTITHSLVGWVIFTLLFSFIIVLPSFVIFNLSFDILGWRWIVAFSLGYLSHIILDMFNRRGSQLFWPDPGRDVIPRNPKFRPESGSKVEGLIFVVLLILVFLALPISKYGLSSSLRWLLASPGSAIQEFKSLKVHAYLEFKGIFRETKEPVAGSAEILDVDRDRLIILYKDSVYTISDELAADIIASHVRVKKTKEPIKTEKVDFEEKTREYLLAQIPKNGLVSGTVHLPKDMEIDFSRPRTSDIGPRTFKPIEQKGDDLILRFANKKQIQDLALSESFDLQKRKDQAELRRLENEASKTRQEIKDIETGEGLTKLGQEMLMSKEKVAEQKQKLAELQSKLEETNIKIDEVRLKIKSRKFVFSGEVYIRQ